VLDRDGARRTFDAVPDETSATKERVALEMARKYGFADRFWSWISDRSRSVALRLEPVDPSDGD
jgi:hypothetical protein